MHVSRLLNALSAALNIPLPHPLSPYSDSGAESMVAPQFDLNAGFYLTPAFYMNDGSEYQLFSWVSTANLRSQNVFMFMCSICLYARIHLFVTAEMWCDCFVY